MIELLDFHIHYEKGISFCENESGWYVKSACGIILLSGKRGSEIPSGSFTQAVCSSRLKDITCEDCKRLYALEFLAEVP